MFFRPTFCAHCGEKIERANWGIFTSRRFCQVCESEFKGQDLIPRFVVGIGVLIGMLGVGGYLKSGSASSDSQLVRQPRKFAEQPVSASQNAPKETPPSSLPSTGLSAANSAASQSQSAVPTRNIDVRTQEPQRPPKVQGEASEELYFCGARTAKGTPCKHRVKGNVRCFQHVGAEAMLPPQQLRIK